jgi:DNA-binding HxlR family transcriptional regulator
MPQRSAEARSKLTRLSALDRCPVARTLAIIGERWTILVLRDLVLHSPNTLSARLKVLEENGIVVRRFYEEHPPRAEYVLTDKGHELRFALKALREWGLKHTG